MPLAFDERGLLCPGIQDATLREVEDAFGRMGRTDTRIRLFANLERWLVTLASTGWAVQVILDGSFVEQAVDEPNDIDIILVMPPDWDPAVDFTSAQQRVVAKRFTHRDYRIEVKPVLPVSEAYSHYVDIYSRVRHDRCREFGWPVGTLKGMVRLVP